MLLLDGREGPTRDRAGKACAATSPSSPRSMMAPTRAWPRDFAYYPPVPQARALDWTGARTRAAHRLGMVALSRALNPRCSRADGAAATLALSGRVPADLLVAMGGSDPQGLTLRAAKALAPLDPAFRIRFVIGTGMKDAAKVARRRRGAEKQLRDGGRRRRSRHRICRGRSGALRLWRHRL